MAKLENNVVPIIVLDDDDEESETLNAGSASKLADFQVIGFDNKEEKDGDGESSNFPDLGKAVDAETIIPKGGQTISVDGITEEVKGHASLNGLVASEQIIKDKEHSCTIEGESEEHGFTFGDFVWCKIKNDPWFPAQVYDSKDASEMALRYRQEGKLLVALFGSGSGAWCLPSQLLPFLENFVQMSRLCDSRIFLKAVQKAIDEFGRIVESHMICKCVRENHKSGLARPMAENGGIKPGVLVPEVKVNQLPVPDYEPFKVLAEVRHFAKTLSVGNKLHLAILKRRLSAFYQFKGGYQLPLYAEPVYIEGLEDKKEQVLSPVVNGFIPFSSGDIIYQRRPEKTLADIMREIVKVVPRSEGNFSAGKGSFSAGKKSRKRKVVVETELMSRKPQKTEPNQESDKVCTTRKTKKSKYLSPPSKFLFGEIGNSSSCKSVSRRMNNKSEKILPDEKLSKKKNCPLSDVGIPVNELLVKLQSAAVTPLYSSNNGSFDKVTAFFSAVRNSTYTKIFRKCTSDPKQKKKPLSSQRKLSLAVRTTPTKMESGETDDLLSDVKLVKKDLETLTNILEKYQTEFSVEEKGSLMEDIKQIKEKVEKVSGKWIGKFLN